MVRVFTGSAAAVVVTEVGQQGRESSLSLFVARCCSAPPGESDGPEENGGRCGSHRHLRRRRGGI